MVKQQSLDKLANKLASENPTPDLAEQATQLVFGKGNPDADVVIIGEAPGKQEDIIGEPFVGASGKFLDELLGSIGLKRQDIYITNIVKYRPPNNRDPLPEEKESMWPYLIKQLEIIDPKVVITLGRHSGQAFIKGLHISADHGIPVELMLFEGKDSKKVTLIPLYHPAAALYNGSLRNTLLEDFKKVAKIIN